MKVSFREILKTIFFCIVSVNLGVSSGIDFLGIVFACAFAYLPIKQFVFSRMSSKSLRVPRYRKFLAYGAIVPCALWWVLTPSVENGVSPFLVYIPAWYMLYLAFLQKRSLGNGGFEVFVVFNGLAVLVMGLFNASRPSIVWGFVALLIAVYAFGRPRVALYKRLLFVLLYVGLCCSSYLGFKYWKSNRVYSGRWAEDYYVKNRVMGFDPAVSLGSFSSNFNSKYNGEIVLRVWDTLASPYLRAAAYEKYVAGIWKLPAKAEQKLYPARYRVDYAVFEKEDSAAVAPDVKSVWVQSSLDNFGFMFAAPNVVGIASKNADSLNYYSTNVYADANGRRSDWFYYVSDSAEKFMVTGEKDSAFLQIPSRNLELLETISKAMGLPSKDSLDIESSGYLFQCFKTITIYFAHNFKYSLVVQKRSAGKDPLALFWENKEGYCEYFATLATLLLRYQGVPARYVTGFARPEYVEGRPYLTFRRHHSHAWVEAYYDHKWYIFDPTPPIMENLFAQPSWISSKFEGMKGRFAYVLHLLKDGEWRHVVDSWQASSERLVSSPILYVVLALLVAVFAGLNFRRSRRKTRNVVVSKNAVQWIALLENAEKRLARLGFVRISGETVSAFMRRVERSIAEMPNAEKPIVENRSGKFARTGDSPRARKKAERIKRECSLVLNQLGEYEKNRWRNV